MLILFISRALNKFFSKFFCEQNICLNYSFFGIIFYNLFYNFVLFPWGILAAMKGYFEYYNVCRYLSLPFPIQVFQWMHI